MPDRCQSHVFALYKKLMVMKVLFFSSLLLSQALAFAPVTTSTARFGLTRVYSSEEAQEELDPFDGYQLGQREIATKDAVMGSGEPAANGDVLTVAFVGKLYPSGTQFLSEDAYPFTVGEGKTLPGFDKGLLGVKEGATRILRVPPTLAYGPSGSGTAVPPNADLEFTCEVKSIARGPIEGAMARFGKKRTIVLGVTLLIFAAAPYLDKLIGGLMSSSNN